MPFGRKKSDYLDQPARFLSQINHELYEQTLDDSFVTCFMGLIDPAAGQLTYASAGHPAPLLQQQDGAINRLGSMDLPLAMVGSHEFRQTSLSLPPGGRLLLYSDAALETTNPAGDQFGIDRLVSLMTRAKDAGPDELLKLVRRSLLEFAETVSLEDDLALMLVSSNG